MARPVPRRRGSSEDETPSAEKYTSRRGRAAEPEPEPEEETRPRRGRGELPQDPEPPSRRSRRAAAEPEGPVEETTEGTPIPKDEQELEGVDDNDYEDLLIFFNIEEGLTENDEFDALVTALKKHWAGPAAPTSRRGRASTPEPEPPASGRRGRSSEPAEEPPARGRGRGRGGAAADESDRPTRQPRAGFEGYKKARQQTFIGDFKLTPELLLCKFLEDEPFDTYVEHGLYEELKKSGGQRVWVCIEDGCPICALGHKGRAMALWNIIAIPSEGEPRLEVLKAGPMLSKEIEKKASLPTGPMSKEYYWLAQPEQERNEAPIAPIVEVVRERDVKDESGFEPFTDKELDEYFEDVPDPKTYLQFPKLSEIKAVAAKLVSD